jgi:hypothetical protein
MSETQYAVNGSDPEFSRTLAYDTIEAMARRASAAARPLAEMSHIAGLAAERLATGLVLSQQDRMQVAAMLLQIIELGHTGFLKRSGSEADFRDIGDEVRARFIGRGGKWRA